VLHTNIMTAAVISGGKIPIIASTDELAIKLALYGSWTLHPEQARIIRITNTLSLKDIQVSTAVAESLHGSAQAECTGKPFPLEFDVSGKLTTTIS